MELIVHFATCMLEDPKLNTGLQVGSHETKVEGQNHLPQPSGHVTFTCG